MSSTPQKPIIVPEYKKPMENKLRAEIIYHWLEQNWLNTHPDNQIFSADGKSILSIRSTTQSIGYSPLGNYKFVGYKPLECDVVINLNSIKDSKHETRSGAYVLYFDNAMGRLEVPIISTTYREVDGHIWAWYLTSLVAIPEHFIKEWAMFEAEFSRVTNAYDPGGKVFVIGGKIESFIPNVEWDSVILQDKLKSDILSDVENFFDKGVGIYKKLKLKPFRKILFAGPPGTGKTMMCTALAKKALEQGRVVIYVSSSHRNQDDKHGATFNKIEQALAMAANSAVPAMIIIEEFDAYLNVDEKSMILNVLDGNESPLNEHGTLIIATTNYPEAIDPRIMKRPGRLDRIFVIPEVKRALDADKILRQYLGDMWNEEHTNIVGELVNYPAAFIREVSIMALTKCACEGLDELPLETLRESFNSLKIQIDARDNFLSGKSDFKAFGPGTTSKEFLMDKNK